MRVVLDTNVLIDGLKDEYSYEKKILDEVVSGGLSAYANKQTIQENRLLSGQLVLEENYSKFLDEFFTQVQQTPRGPHVNIVRDPEDNKILASAIAAKAEYLITSDRDLLDIANYRGVKIVRPAQFWANYHDDGEDLWKQWTSFVDGQK